MSDLETFQRPPRSVPGDALTIPCTSSGQTLPEKLRRDSYSGAPAGRRFFREIRGELSRVTPRRNLTQALTSRHCCLWIGRQCSTIEFGGVDALLFRPRDQIWRTIGPVGAPALENRAVDSLVDPQRRGLCAL